MTRMLAFLLFVAMPGIAWAQEDFSHLKAKVGQHLLVTIEGMTASGVLTELTPQRIVVGNREFVPGPGMKIERDNGNTVERGLWTGAGVGAMIGLAAGPAGAVMAAPSGAFWGALIGAGRDRVTLLYLTSVTPDPNPQRITPKPEPAAAPADVDFSGLKLKPGQLVIVTDGDVETNGIVSDLSPQRLVLGTTEITPHRNLRIEKEGDPVWDGAAYGFIAGALLGPTIGSEGCLDRPMWHCVVEGGVSLAVIGALFDWAHTGRTTVYDGSKAAAKQARWHVLPAIDAHTKAVAVTKQFR